MNSQTQADGSKKYLQMCVVYSIINHVVNKRDGPLLQKSIKNIQNVKGEKR